MTSMIPTIALDGFSVASLNFAVVSHHIQGVVKDSIGAHFSEKIIAEKVG